MSTNVNSTCPFNIQLQINSGVIKATHSDENIFTCIIGPPESGKTSMALATLHGSTFIYYDKNARHVDEKIRHLLSIGRCPEVITLVLDNASVSTEIMEKVILRLVINNIRLIVISQTESEICKLRDNVDRFVFTGWTTIKDQKLRAKLWKLEKFFKKQPYAGLVMNASYDLLGWYQPNCAGTLTIKHHNKLHRKLSDVGNKLSRM